MSNENENSSIEGLLTKEERDMLSELTSISMGAAGSTLGILLGKEVEIMASSAQEYTSMAEMDTPFGDIPKTLVMVQYVKGLYATSLFILKNPDACQLSEMMLGGMGGSDEAAGETLNDMQNGAIGELMNQMMNSSATSLASVIRESVEINNPEVFPYTTDTLGQCLPQLLEEPFIANPMQIKIGAELVIELIELKTVSEVQAQVAQVMAVPPDNSQDEAENEDGPGESMNVDSLLDSLNEQASQGEKPARSSAKAALPPRQNDMQVDPVTVRPIEFASFDHQPNVFGEENKNLDLVLDVTLNLTVELGKTDLSIKEVLELTRGSVIELERIAGEPVDLMANNKLIAKGEVVVIEDNFGLRITSIVSPADRLRGL